MCLKKALLASSLSSGRKSISIVLLLLAAGVVLCLSSSSSILDHLGFLHELRRFFLFTSKVGFALEFDFLHLLTFVELEALAEFSN